MKSKQVFSSPRKAYSKMLADIRAAKKEILLETYIYSDDSIGQEFRAALTKKAAEGVKVKILIDGWGTEVRRKYFKGLIDFGGEVRFFRNIRYTFRFIKDNHERNHRKLLVVDGKISYMGSINITSRCLNWVELVLRFEGTLAMDFRRSFNRSWKRFQLFSKKKMTRILHEGFVIINDFPSLKNHPTEKSFKRLLRRAKKEVLIETPYFVPSILLRREIKNAISRGVNVKLIMPRRSDVLFADFVRDRVLGQLHKMGVEIHFHPKMLHSKLMVVDDQFFLLGSSNLDYRSLVHQYEINLLGKDPELIEMLRRYFKRNLRVSPKFSYGAWLNRHKLRRFMERILYRFRKYF